MSARGGRRFLVAFAITISSSFAAVPATNIIVDPFWRFNLVTIPGMNEQRPVFSSFARMGKAGVVCRLQPTQVVMGTSRVEVGIDPKHPGWGSEPGPVYNLGLSGIGLQELSLTFRHLVNASSRLKRVVIGLDFLMFNANREAVVFGTEVLDFDREQLVLTPSDGCSRSLWYNAQNLFGDTGLYYSYRTVTQQLGSNEKGKLETMGAWEALYDRQGFRSYFPVGAQTQIDVLGPRIPFAQEGGYVAKVWRAPPDERYCFTRPGQPNTMDVFRDLVLFARQSGVDVRFYLEPVHARMMLALQDAGLWPQFEDWKRGVVSVLNAESKESGKPQFPVWDFSGFNSVTNEHLPPDADKTSRLRGFWEAAHYKKEVGDLILDRILDYHAPDRIVPADFGMRLSAENIDSWLTATRNAGRDYIRAEPDEGHAVYDLVAHALKGSSGSNCGYYMDELRVASAALLRGDRDGANAAIERAKAINAADRRRAAEMDVSYWEPGFAAALDAVESGQELITNLPDWQSYQRRGAEREEVGDHLGAAEDFAHAIRIGPPNTALRFQRGVALLHAGEREKAVVEFSAGLDLDPQNVALRNLRDQARQQVRPEASVLH